MHLKELKLSGFKSFVDPTLIPFPSQLTAVVGPNGCGKSNIIDAVRWVMGESSAKTLRGESMTDVIFNGSLNRKPVGQASVELVFDNSLGRFAGPHANYQEISIKRLVTRHGESFYYLNGSKCRRRDIFDIFLGTGAGTKGYAIIGQDMISKLIEAKPEELKGYIEEAAGVSKYKERRRESLQRIEQTRENLARVNDVRDELHKQLQRLERQAKIAEKYTLLKKEERHFRAEILGLKWKALKKDETAVRQEILNLSLVFEKLQAALAHSLDENQSLRINLEVLRDNVQEAQNNSYQMGTKIARMEEHLHQQKREKERLSYDLQQIVNELKQTQENIGREQIQWQACSSALEAFLIEIENAQKQLGKQLEEFHSKQLEEQSWRTEWQNLQSLENKNAQQIELSKLRLQNLEQQRQKNQLQMEKLLLDKKNIQLEPLSNDLDVMRQQTALSKEQYNELTRQQETLINSEAQISREITEIELRIHAAQDTFQQHSAQHAALQAAQNAALKSRDGKLNFENTENLKRLFDDLEVEEQWIKACEFVLEDCLNAFILDDQEDVLVNLKNVKQGPVVFVTEKSRNQKKKDKPLLIDKIKGKLPHWIFSLDTIIAANTLDEAITYLPQLESTESIITLDGFWLGVGWMKAANFDPSVGAGLIQQKQALITAEEKLVKSKQVLDNFLEQRQQCHQQLTLQRQQLEDHQRSLAQFRKSLHELEAEENRKMHLLEQMRLKILVIDNEQLELQEALESITVEYMDIEQEHLQSLKTQKELEEQKEQLQAQYNKKSQDLEVCRTSLECAKTALQQIELQKEKEQMRAQQLQDSIQKEEARLNKLNAQKLKLEEGLQGLEALEELRETLEEDINTFRTIEDELLNKRKQLEELQFQLNTAEHENLKVEQQAKEIQNKIQEQTMLEQSLIIRLQGFYESLMELEVDVEYYLINLPESDLSTREHELTQLVDKINRLGPVNLVAIQEYETESERKRHLDEQHLDLTHAIDTLHAAISKMDKETELRLQATFAQVNSSFQKLFPRLFGGGRAILELTCDNLLEAGISVTAQPPGKRNSTIHMLSGGEKAMTAVALVFAIFQLNPSPFCMLDEVDAPLDDANVQRFCDMVKEMSEFVQFLFITHNKVTMEMANQLIGVTMREPGVSRIVSVDVEQALSIAE